MKPIRILQVFASLDRGGAETMIMNIYRNIDKKKVQFDFVVNNKIDEYSYESEIKKMGGRIYRMPKYQFKNHLSYKKKWRELLVDHPEWKIIHAHHTTPAFIYLKIAKKLKRITIAHSHTAGGEKTLRSYVRRLMRYPLRMIPKYYFACSKSAAEWMFGRKSIETYILNNAVDTDEFIFDYKQRIDIRKKMKIEDNFVVGHIGRFDQAKNHDFLIDIFYAIQEHDKNSMLILIGDGKNKKLIEQKVQNLGLEDNVIFTGVRKNIAELLQGMDVFLFPSLFEGLPVTLVEAQAAGLHCVVSDTITDEVEVTKNLLEFVSLNCSSHEWAEKILRHKNSSRRNVYSEVVNSGYDINTTTNQIQQFYLTNNYKIN